MSSFYAITCKKECKNCEHKGMYDKNAKFPFHCYRPDQYNNPAIKTKEFCGSNFVNPAKILKSCRFIK